jgi:hypothetical protein
LGTLRCYKNSYNQSCLSLRYVVLYVWPGLPADDDIGT